MKYLFTSASLSLLIACTAPKNTSENTLKETPPQAETPTETTDKPAREGVITNELIITTDHEKSMRQLAKTWKTDYDFEIVKRITPSMNLWLCSFNTEKIAPGQMYVKVKEAPGVKAVEFNRRVQVRGR